MEHETAFSVTHKRGAPHCSLDPCQHHCRPAQLTRQYWYFPHISLPLPSHSCSHNFWKIAGSCHWHLTCAIAFPHRVPKPLLSSHGLAQDPAALCPCMPPPNCDPCRAFLGGISALGCILSHELSKLPSLGQASGLQETCCLSVGPSCHWDEVFWSDGRRHWLNLVGPVILAGTCFPPAPAGVWSS